MPSVLIVHPEDTAYRRIASALSALEMDLTRARSALSMFRHLWTAPPDILLLSDNLPGMDVLEICRQIRSNERFSDLRIMVIGNSRPGCDAREAICALEAGADDCVDETCAYAELAARVRALARRAKAHNRDEQASQGPLSLVSGLPCARVGERSVWLTRTEYRLLRHLVWAGGTPVSPATLLRVVWDRSGETGDTGLVRAHIHNLRKKIETDPSQPTYILTHHSFGYYVDNLSAGRGSAQQVGVGKT